MTLAMGAPLAVFRADAAPELGGGHVMRCLALAQALGESGWLSVFAGGPQTIETVPAISRMGHAWIELSGGAESEPAALESALGRPCDLLVVDHYGRGADFETACRKFARQVLSMDDEPNRAHDCDLLLDPAPGASAERYAGLVPPRCVLLIGPNYALLRRQFAQARPAALARRQPGHDVARIFVGMGATDPAGLTVTVLKGILAAQTDAVVDVVLGAASPHLADVQAVLASFGGKLRIHVDASDVAALMAAADLAVGAGGTSSFERCCLGLPTLTVIAAENQRRNAQAFAAAGAAVLLGDGSTLTAATVAAALRPLLADGPRRAALSSNAAALCDGQGALRVVRELVGRQGHEARNPRGARR